MKGDSSAATMSMIKVGNATNPSITPPLRVEKLSASASVSPRAPSPPGEASDSQAGRAASGEGFIDSRLGVHHSLNSLPASREDVALDFSGKSVRRGFTVSSLQESRTEAVTNGKRYVV